MRYLKSLTCAWSLSALLLLACSSSNGDDNGGTTGGGNQGDGGQRVETELYGMLGKCASIKTISAWQDQKLADGVTYVKTSVVKTSGRKDVIYIVKKAANAPGAALKTGLNVPADGDKWPYEMSFPLDIAKKFDTTGESVVALQGGDFSRWLDYQLADPQPIDFGCRGPVHHRGKVLQDHFVPEEGWAHQALSFIGIDKSGKMVIGDAADYPSKKSSLQECTGGGYRIVRDGTVCKGYDLKVNGEYAELEDKYPFSSIGCRADGTIIMLICDGRTDVSTGLTYAEAGNIMKAMGCEQALMLDGGGSAQMFIKSPKTGTIALQNKPTDGGQRKMRTYWMLTVTK